MARITVEDCIDKFPSRFELVLVASNRARKLHSGETPNVDKDNDKNTVIALREIADEKLSIDNLKNDLIEEYQTVTLTEDEEETDLNNDIDDKSSEEENLLQLSQEETDEVKDEVIDEKKNTDEETEQIDAEINSSIDELSESQEEVSD